MLRLSLSKLQKLMLQFCANIKKCKKKETKKVYQHLHYSTATLTMTQRAKSIKNKRQLRGQALLEAKY